MKERGKIGNELLRPKIHELVSAAKSEDWARVDEVLIPEIKKLPDGNAVATELLKYLYYDNPNVRDVVATGLAAIEITQKSLLHDSFGMMAVMSLSDPDVFPSGRAAMFLVKCSNLEEFSNSASVLLADFSKRASDMGWNQELIENIPGMSNLLA